MNKQEIIEWLNSGIGRKRQLSIAMGKYENFAYALCEGKIRNIDTVLVTKCIQEIDIQDNSYRCDAIREICSIRGNATKLAIYLGISRQAVSRKLRNTTTINDEQWCKIKSFAKETGYGL